MSPPFIVAVSPKALARGEGWECVCAQTAEQAADMLPFDPVGNELTVQCPDGSIEQIEIEYPDYD